MTQQPDNCARPLSEWHEDMGPMLWWRFPIDEPPYVGGPLDCDWPECHTHWTPIPMPAGHDEKSVMDHELIADLERDALRYERCAGEAQKKANTFRQMAMRARMAISHLRMSAVTSDVEQAR